MKTAVFLTFSFLLSLSVCLAQQTRPSHPGNPESIAKLQTQVDESTTSVNELAEKIRAAKASDKSSVQDVEALMKQLTQAVSDSFALQTKLQLAQLADAEAKIAASRQLITERQQHADDIVGKRLQDLLSVPAYAESPQAVLDAMERFTAAKDYDGLVSLMTDDEADRMAGMLMHSMSMMNSTLALMETSTDTIDDSEQIRSIIASGDRFKRPNPSAEATAALQQLISILPSVFYQLGATIHGKPLERPNLTAKEYATLLRQASGVLTDKRAYSAAMMKVASAMEGESEDEAIKSEWKIEIDRIRATATQMAQPVDRTTNKTAKVELEVEDGLWKISKLVSDEEMMQTLAGPSVISANPKTPPTSASSQDSIAQFPQSVPYPVSSEQGNPGAPSPLGKREDILPDWKNFLELLPESGTALVMFNDGSENSQQMRPVAKSVAESTSVQFIEQPLPDAPWIAQPSVPVHRGQGGGSGGPKFVLMKDRQWVGTRIGLLTEKRLRDFVSTAENWLTPHSTGVDENSLVRIDCYINSGTGNIGSQYGSVHSLTTAVVAIHEDQALLFGPDSIAEYLDAGYACVAVVHDESGKQKQVPLDILQVGPVKLLGQDANAKKPVATATLTFGDGQTSDVPLNLNIYPKSVTEPLDAYETGSAIYPIRGAHGLTTVRLAATDYLPKVDQRVLSGGFRDRPFPRSVKFPSAVQWQTQLVESNGGHIYGGNINGAEMINVICPTVPAPRGFTFSADGGLIGKIGLGYPTEKDMTHTVFQPVATHSVLRAALEKIEDGGLKTVLSATLQCADNR